MMRRPISLLSAGAALFASALLVVNVLPVQADAHDDDSSDDDSSDDDSSNGGMATPEALFAEFETAFDAGDLDALMDLYESGAVFVPAPGVRIVGKPAIRLALADFLAAQPQIDFVATEVVLAGDTALVRADYILTFPGPFVQTGTTSDVLHDDGDNGWRFRIDHP